jgi:fatty acid desaturase
MGVWLWLLPHWVANCVTMGSGMYAQHAGCLPRSDTHPTAHSNTFVNDFFNRTMFHIGYHVEHHDHAGVHWADLPAFHAQHRASLVHAGAHVVTCGYYGAASRLSVLWGADAALDAFTAEQAPGYERAHERTPIAVLLAAPGRAPVAPADAANERAASA